MGLPLLGFTNLLTVLLLAAFLASCLGRLRYRLLRMTLFLVPALGFLLSLLCADCVLAVFACRKHLVNLSWAYSMVAMTLFHALGVIGIGIALLRRNPERPDIARSGTWPRVRLGLSVAAALALQAVTLWRIDLDVRHRLAALQAEASELALSVALPDVPDDENAALIYQRAFEAMGDSDSWPSAYEETWECWTYDNVTEFDAKDTALRAFLKQQSGALALLRAAIAKRHCRFDRDYAHPDMFRHVPESKAIGEASRLLALDARLQAADGNKRGALADCQALLVLAEHAASDPNLVPLLVSVAAENIAAFTLAPVLAATSPSIDDLRLVTPSQGFSYPQALQRALIMEEACGEMLFYDLGMGRKTLCELTDGPAKGTWVDHMATLGVRLFLIPEDLASYRRLIREYQQWAGQPYWKAANQWDRLQERIDSQPGILTRLVLPMTRKVATATARADARQQLVTLGVAAYRFRAAQKQLPQSIDQLVPEFLPAVPLDPFDGKPFRMKKTAGGLVFYSIGTDGIDNEGASLNAENGTGDITFTVVR